MGLNNRGHMGFGLGLNNSNFGVKSLGGVFSLPTAFHEWNAENATIVGSTMTLVDTGSIGGVDLINPTASQLPTIGAIGSKPSVIYDGTDDILQNSVVTDFRKVDSTGVMHFVFRTPSSFSANNNFLLSVSESGSATDRVLFFVQPTGGIRLIISASGLNSIYDGIVLSTDTNYIITTISDGSTNAGYLGTTLQWDSAGAGRIWFADITDTTTGLEIGSREIGGAAYGVGNVAYACYTPYVSDAAALADQLTIANEYGITV